MKNMFAKLWKWWIAFARALGKVNTFILLTLIYSILFGVVAAGLRLFGKDPLRRRKSKKDSFWIPKEEVDHSMESARHQF